MAACLVVKNTFICVDDDAAASPRAGCTRKRATTDWTSLSFATKTLSERSNLSVWSEDTEEPLMEPTDSMDSELAMVEATPSTMRSLSAWPGASPGVAGSPCFFPEAAAAEPLAVQGQGPTQLCLFQQLRQSVSNVAFDMEGAARLLVALREAGPHEAVELISSLRGQAGQAARSVHASSLLIEAISMLGTEDVAFIAKELRPEAHHTALNVHGSAVVIQLLSYSAEHPATIALVDEVLEGDVVALCLHKFGHAVAMSVLSSGLPHQRQRVLAALRQDLPRFARHRFATQVLVEAFEQTSLDECSVLVTELLERSGTVLSLACHGFGVQVVRTMLGLSPFRQQIMYYLEKSARRVMKDRYGADLMRELGYQTAEAVAAVPAPAA